MSAEADVRAIAEAFEKASAYDLLAKVFAHFAANSPTELKPFYRTMQKHARSSLELVREKGADMQALELIR